MSESNTKKYHHVVVYISETADQKQTTGPCWGKTVLIHDLPVDVKVEDLIEMGSCVGAVMKVHLLLDDREAHMRFSEMENAIKFMEMANAQPILSGTKLLMTRSSTDYPCLVVRGLPESVSKDFLIDAIKHQAPDFELVQVCVIRDNQAVVQFASHRIAGLMRLYAQKHPLFIGGKELTFDWEGTPAARVTIPRGFRDKDKIRKAFDVIEDESSHVLGVALLKDRAYVYFDYRFRLKEASDIIGDTLTIVMDDGSVQEFLYFLF